MDATSDGATASLRSIWRRVLGLSWPVMAEQFLNTLMRTTDVIVAGFFSPAAVAAVGLADIYGRLPLRVGLGVGDAAIALSSQDTGAGAVDNRDEAVTVAILMGLLAGVPFVLFGLALNEAAISVLGAAPDVVRFGATYLAVILAVSPARHIVLIASRAIQGTGDTRTPMYVNGAASVVNIAVTVVLAFGLGPAPALSILGIAVATAIATTLAAATFLALIASPWSELGFVAPTRFVVARQLAVVAAPRVAEGGTELVADFPFNAILLGFGTEVNAAFHVGQRMYHQIAAPLSRGYAVGANILVGQALGRGDRAGAYRNGWATATVAAATVGGIGAVLFVFAEWFVLAFTRHPETVAYGTNFARTYAAATVVVGAYVGIAGALRGGSETTMPFVARLTGTFVFLLGITYVLGVHLGYGVVAAYVAIVADWTWRTVVVGATFLRRRWLDRGTRMMYDRGSLEPGED